ncbi:MAG TPA: hypothetical protein VHT29_15270 [Solirubrobacteraceae bacterium]|jgi:hypothetical protein|nr:hypothetical protein [Solirubrobacteraceae bacterium]
MALFLDIVNLALIGCAVLVVGGFVFWIVFTLVAFVGWVRDRMPHRARLEFVRYSAEQEIRSIRRQAVRDMLEAESVQRLAYSDPAVIEGTAVEVGRS